MFFNQIKIKRFAILIILNAVTFVPQGNFEDINSCVDRLLSLEELKANDAHPKK